VAASVGVASGPFDVVWIGADSAAVTPEEGARLVVEVLDTAVARVDTVAGMPWQFTVTGLTNGSTSITVKLEHAGHFDFESQPIPLTVTTAVSPQAFWVQEACNPVAFWNFDTTNGANQTHGGLIVEPGATRGDLRATFLGDELASAYGREELQLDSSYSLEWEVQNTAIARLASDGDAFTVNLQGVQAGNTTVTFRLVRHGGVVYATGSINVHVAAKPAPSAAPDFTLKKDGVWTLINRAGTLMDADCGRAPGPGHVGAPTDVLSSLYWIKLLKTCSESNPSSTYTFLFEFEDPCVASVLNHPIHWGERSQFHVYGIQEGQTNVTIYAVRNGVLEYVTPALPVVVTP
jgi:hypothetical protein